MRSASLSEVVDNSVNRGLSPRRRRDVGCQHIIEHLVHCNEDIGRVRHRTPGGGIINLRWLTEKELLTVVESINLLACLKGQSIHPRNDAANGRGRTRT